MNKGLFFKIQHFGSSSRIGTYQIIEFNIQHNYLQDTVGAACSLQTAQVRYTEKYHISNIIILLEYTSIFWSCYSVYELKSVPSLLADDFSGTRWCKGRVGRSRTVGRSVQLLACLPYHRSGYFVLSSPSSTSMTPTGRSDKHRKLGLRERSRGPLKKRPPDGAGGNSWRENNVP